MNMFEGYVNWKSTRSYICQTGSLSLWIAVMSMKFDSTGYRIPFTREEDMKLIRDFPYDFDPKCRCKWCRYGRMTRNWSNL